jgi:uncharacterized delta-60 repeat protein
LSVLSLLAVGLLGLAPAPVAGADDPTSSIDPTYGIDGVASIYDEDETPFLLAEDVDPLGRVVALPIRPGAPMRRLTADGELDTTFGSDGGLVLPGGSTWLRVRAEASHTYALGKVDVDEAVGVSVPAIARLTDAGELDPSWGGDGVLEVGEAVRGRGVVAADESPDGALVASFEAADPDDPTAWRYVIVRILPNGALDSSFGSGGRVVLPSRHSVGPDGLRVDAAGRVLVVEAQYDQSGSTETLRVRRLLGSGAPDPSFGTDGVALLGEGEGASIAISDSDGALIVGGDGGVRAGSAMWKLRDDGSLDPSFGSRGAVRSMGPEPSGAVDVYLVPNSAARLGVPVGPLQLR